MTGIDPHEDTLSVRVLVLFNRLGHFTGEYGEASASNVVIPRVPWNGNETVVLYMSFRLIGKCSGKMWNSSESP